MSDELKPKKSGNDDTEKQQASTGSQAVNNEEGDNSSQELFWKKGSKTDMADRIDEHNQTNDVALAEEEYVDLHEPLTIIGALIWSIVLLVVLFVVFAFGRVFQQELYSPTIGQQMIILAQLFISVFICSFFGLWLLTNADRIKFIIIFLIFAFFSLPVLGAVYLYGGNVIKASEYLLSGMYSVHIKQSLSQILGWIYAAILLYFSLFVSSKIIEKIFKKKYS